MYTLINDDCMSALKRIKDKSIDLIICDLPYGITARNKWDTIIPMEDYCIINNKTYNQNEYILYAYKNNIPYPKAYNFFMNNKMPGLWSEYKRIIKDNTPIILFGNGLFTAYLMNSNKEMFRYNLI